MPLFSVPAIDPGNVRDFAERLAPEIDRALAEKRREIRRALGSTT